MCLRIIFNYASSPFYLTGEVGIHSDQTHRPTALVSGLVEFQLDRDGVWRLFPTRPIG